MKPLNKQTNLFKHLLETSYFKWVASLILEQPIPDSKGNIKWPSKSYPQNLRVHNPKKQNKKLKTLKTCVSLNNHNQHLIKTLNISLEIT